MFPYKDDNPIRIVPVSTILLIALNVFAFIFERMAGWDGRAVALTFGAIPSDIIGLESGQPIHPFLTVFTSMFLHGGVFHIFGNMLYLWIFGNNVEEQLGHIKFIFFYLFCGVLAVLAHAMLNPSSQVPMIGASGAVSGVLGAYLVLFPLARVHTIVILGFFVQVVKIPALIVIGFWAIIQVINGIIVQGFMQQGGIAWFAHVGGFLAGLLTIRLWKPRRFAEW